MPPRSSISFCSGSRSITGYGVSGSISVEFAPSRPHDVAGELRHRDVHAEADAEVRDPLLARDAAGEDLALPAARAEAAGDEHAVGRLELLDRLLVGHVLGVEPAHVHLRALVHAGVLERLVHGEVGVVQLHVLADERDLDVLAPLDDQVGEVLPLAEHGGRRVEAEPLADELVEALALQELRDQVDVGHVRRADHGPLVDVGEERDLLADLVGEHVAGAADDDVGVDADAAQLVDGVLRRLRLQLACRLDERHERDVQVEDVLLADLAPELADRLEERQRLDVADRAADLGDHDVGRAARRRRGGCAP